MRSGRSQISQISQKHPNNIQRMFLNHCATLIQAHLKRYIQQKRYRKFLPIYRRMRQLLQAVVEGWRVRKIMQLQSIKQSIKSITEKTRRKETAHVRIAKRQLGDEIGRLQKKGAWIEVLRRQRKKLVVRKRPEVSKQNSAMYANVKAASIKNIFGVKQTSKPKYRSSEKEQGKPMNLVQADRQNPYTNLPSQIYETKKYSWQEQPLSGVPLQIVPLLPQQPSESNRSSPANRVIKGLRKKQGEATPHTRSETQVLQETISDLMSVRSEYPSKKKSKLTITLASSSKNNNVGTVNSLINSSNASISQNSVHYPQKKESIEESFLLYQRMMQERREKCVQKISSFHFNSSQASFRKAYANMAKRINDCKKV